MAAGLKTSFNILNISPQLGFYLACQKNIRLESTIIDLSKFTERRDLYEKMDST